MFSKSKITQSMIDAVNTVVGLTEKVDVKKRTTDTLAGRVKIPPTSGDNEHTDYKVELNAEETDKGESSTDAKGNKTTKYKDGSWQTETPTHKDDGKNPEGKVHHLSDVARRKMIKMNANNEEVELDEVLDTRKSIKSYLDKNDAQRTTLKASGTFDKVKKRLTGANKALDKLSKLNREEVEVFAKVPKSKRFVYGHKVSFHAHGKDIVGHVSDSNPTHAKVSVRNPEKGDPHNWNVPHKHLTMVHDSNKARAQVTKEEYLDEENAVDKVTMDIPLLIRIMEYSKEDAKSDMDLHKVAENLVEYSKSGKTLTMACYNHVVGINEAKRPEDDSVPFITNEAGLSGHVNSIKKLVKHTFKKVKANESYYDDDPDVARADRELARMKAKPIKADRKTNPEKEMSKLSKRAPKEDTDELDKDLTHKEEFNLGESSHTERKKSFIGMLDRISAKAKENTKLQQNRKIEPKLPKKVEESEKPTTAHFTDPKGIKRKQPNDPFYPEYDKHEQGKPSEAKKARLGLKSEEVELDEMNIGKKQPRPDTHHIVDKENKPLSLAAYYDKAKAEKDRDEKHPGAKVITRGPRGKVKEEVELDELDEAKKDSYQIYHPTYSSAVQHAEKHLNKQGFDIHPDDWFHHVNAGPSKPAEGKTVSLHIPLHKDGVPSKKVAHIQVYNRGNDLANNHELNMYHN